MTSFSAKLLFRRLPATVLAGCLLSAPPLTAQSSGIAASPGAPRELHIIILEGEDALNNIRQRTAREPIVKVEDENHKPVAGAAILFAIHGGSSGAGGSFAGASTLAAQTDGAGQAVATGFHPNRAEGRFEIEVTATLGALVAVILIHQENVTLAEENASQATPVVVKPAHRSRNAWTATGALAAGVATVIAVVLLNGNKGATITAGAGGVGHP